jgi:hypothetical protein
MTDRMSEIPQADKAAAGAIERYCDDLGIEMPSPALASALGRVAAEAAAPHLGAAWWDRLIGFRVNGRLYHPTDVEIIYREEDTDVTQDPQAQDHRRAAHRGTGDHDARHRRGHRGLHRRAGVG